MSHSAVGHPRTSIAARLFHIVTLMWLGLMAIAPTQAQTIVAGKTPGQFGVSPSGAATYSIPIQVPPGIAGMQPKLSLEYNSQGGNGIMGMGWNLAGLSSITRCPQTKAQDGPNAIGGIRYDWNDRYCMDGQRLILVDYPRGDSVTYESGLGSRYRTEIESFSEITPIGVQGNGPASFTVRTKAGLSMEYGGTADSRIEAQGQTSVMVWAVNQITDVKGNSMTFAYDEVNANGEFSLRSITYGNSSVQFAYETKPQVDVQTGYRGGFKVTSSMRLTMVSTLVASATVQYTALAYSQSANTQRSLLNSVKVCDANGSCLPPTTFNWRDGGQGIAKANNAGTINGAVGWKSAFDIYPGDYNGDGITDLYLIHKKDHSEYFCPGPVITSANDCVPAKPSSTTGFPITKAYSADFDGDGIADLVILGANGVPNPRTGELSLYRYGTILCKGSRTVNIWNNCSYGSTNLNGGSAGTVLPDLQVGDFNNDGVSDVILTTGQATFFCAGPVLTTDMANCKTIQSGSNWLSQFRIYSGDFNGDGVADIYLIGDAGNYFCPGPGIAWANNCGPVAGASGWKAAFSLYPGDYNGDGITDLFLIGDGASYFCPGPGIATTNNCSPIAGAAGWKAAFSIYPGDYNGDGITDLFLIGDGASYFCPGPVIASANNCSPIAGASGWKAAFNIYPGDYNGDGIVDLMLISDGASYFTSGGDGISDILSGVSNGAGDGKLITSTPLTKAAYAIDTGAVYPKIDLQIPLYVVSQVDTSNGVGGINSTQYSYGGLKAEQGTGRGMLGFRTMSTTEVATGITSKTEFRQDWPYIGMPMLSYTTHPDARGPYHLLKRSSSNPGCKIPQNNTACSIAPGNRYFIYTANSTEESWDLNGTAFPTLRTEYDYQPAAGDGTRIWGDPTKITVTTVVNGVDGGSKVTDNTYDTANTSNWILGRLLKAKVTSTSPVASTGVGILAGGLIVGNAAPTPPSPTQLQAAKAVLPAIRSLLLED
jgi:Salmonella virulence plasmid 65kDa B protein/FG-GAP-like repeat